MARYGAGSIYPYQGGYRGSVTIDGKRRFVRGKTSQEVSDRLDEMRRRAREGLPQDDASLTVRAFLTRWLDEYAPARASVKSTNTLDQYRWAVELHLVPALGRHRLRALTAEHVEKMLRDKAAAGMAHNTVSRLRSVLVMALTFAERRDLVARNVARLAEMPADTKPPKEGRSLTVEQAGDLLDAARGDRLEALYLCGLMLGMRPGELLGLCWEDLDLDAATMQIRRSLKRERDPETRREVLRLGEPKTAKSRRALDLPAPVVAALRAHRTAQATERLAAGPAWEDSWGLVFCTTTGRPMDPSNLRRSLSALTKAAGLGHWHPHELRHSAASLLSAAGVPLEQIADVLGHDGTRMTALVYRHATAPTVSAAVAPMEAMFAN